MNTTIHKFTLLFATCLLGSLTGHAYEQDNWYLAWEKSISNSYGVAYYEDNSTGIGQIYQLNGSNESGKISVYDLNGSLDRHITIASTRRDTQDLCLDAEGNIYIAEYNAVTCLANDGTFKWRKGKNASMSSYGAWSGNGNGEFNKGIGITQGPNGNLYVADRDNHRVQVLDKNGTFIKKFGEGGSAPGQLSSPQDLIFLPDGRLIVGDNSYLNYFDSNGTFITRTNSNSAKQYVSLAPDGTIWSYQRLRDADASQIVYQSTVTNSSRTAFTPEGDLIESGNSKLRLWKRAYRTKGLVNRNVIPQPAIRGVTQRGGTNIIDLDFEIIDPDDANATVGILAAQDGAFDNTSKWILPQTWVDGSGSKIGGPIATNQVHRVSWNVKPDWPDSTGTLKFEIICHDARRADPVDLHFLTLPLLDGNLTISRSPLKDSDFESYAKFLLTTGQAELNATSNEVQLPPATLPSGDFVFTSAGKTGKDAPTSAEVNANYVGTPLEGNVTMTIQGIQEWTVPETGVYSIEAAGAQGGWGHGQSSKPGYGARMIGKFNLTVGEVLKIVVGQQGISGGNYNGGGGGGGSFVWITGASNPLIIGGGGGGGAGDSHGQNRHATDASTSENGLPSYSGNPGGLNGSHGSD